MMNFIRSAVLTLMLVPAIGAAQGFDAGLDAYRSGDFATALHELKPFAEQGDALAQGILGVMYQMGQGVAQDDAEAARWYRLAAEQGVAAAQGAGAGGAEATAGGGRGGDGSLVLRWALSTTASVIAYHNHHSLTNHDAGAGNSDTDARNWIERFGPIATYSESGQFVQAREVTVPPFGDRAAEDTTSYAVNGWTGLSSVNHLTFQHDNFQANGRAPNVAGGAGSPQYGVSYVARFSEIIDAWEANAPNPDRIYWVQSDYREDGSFNPATAGAGDVATWFATSLADSTTSDWAGWTDEFVSQMQAAYPALDIRHMDINRVWISTYQNTALGTVPIAEIWEDNAPHGYSDTYIIVGAIMYTYFYGEAPSASFVPAGGTSINSAITSNWAAIVGHIENTIFPPLAAPVVPDPFRRNKIVE